MLKLFPKRIKSPIGEIVDRVSPIAVESTSIDSQHRIGGLSRDAEFNLILENRTRAPLAITKITKELLELENRKETLKEQLGIYQQIYEIVKNVSQ